MNKLCLRLAVPAMLLLFSLSSFGKEGPAFHEALQSFAKKDYKKSKSQIIQLLKRDKKNALYWFNLGHVFNKLSEFSKAIKSYEKVISLQSPLAPVAEYYKAQALVELGKIAEARKELKAVISTGKLPSNLRGKAISLHNALSSFPGMEKLALQYYQNGNYSGALRLLRNIPPQKISDDGNILLMMVYVKMNNWKEFQEMKRRYFRMPTTSTARRSLVLDLEKNFPLPIPQTRPIHLFLDVSAGNNSNVYADGDSAEPLESVEYRISAGGNYQWGLGEGNFLRAGYTFFRNSFKEAPELESNTHNVRLSYLSVKDKNSFELTPYYQLQSWDGVNVSNRLGLISLYSLGFDSGEMGILGDVSRRSSTDQDYSYLDSTSLIARTFVNWISSNFLFELNASVGHDGTQDIDYSDGGRLPLRHYFYGPGFRMIYRPNDTFVVTGLASYLLREYENEAVPGEKNRSDQELSYSVRLNYYFIPSASVYLQYEGIDNSSSLGAEDVRDKNYNVNTQSIGLTWEYL
jgi:tetratricopeptide (TPR) repeat protein